jgi:hypothetical protein
MPARMPGKIWERSARLPRFIEKIKLCSGHPQAGRFRLFSFAVNALPDAFERRRLDC